MRPSQNTEIVELGRDMGDNSGDNSEKCACAATSVARESGEVNAQNWVDLVAGFSEIAPMEYYRSSNSFSGNYEPTPSQGNEDFIE